MIPDDSAEDLYENAPCGYVSTSADGTIVRVNATFIRWTGFTRDAIVAKRRLADLFTAGGRIFYETHFAPLLALQGFVNEIALDIACADGRVLPVLVNAAQRTDEAGNVVGARMSIVDVSDRRRFERELIDARKRAENAMRAKSDFVSMVSHELRTPLNAIAGVAHLLAKTPLTPQQEKYVRILQSSTANLGELVNDILDLGKIEAGKVTLEKRVFDVRARVYDVAHPLGVKADEKKLPVTVHVDEDVPRYIVGDPLKFGQILTNLVGNAIKFTAKGGVEITCASRMRADKDIELELRVKDTGIGIAPDRIGALFEDFTQASYDITARYGGTGLGLAIVRRLVELHGGRVGVESTPGRGSTFWFTLRVGATAAVAEEESTRDDEGAGLEGLHALVADDNEVNVFVVTGMLRRWGITFDVAADGGAAFALARDKNYDVILMDVRMPDVDGYEATRRIRALDDPRGRVPILAVSASTRVAAGTVLTDAGFTGFVGKPISAELLAEALRRATGRKRVASATVV